MPRQKTSKTATKNKATKAKASKVAKAAKAAKAAKPEVPVVENTAASVDSTTEKAAPPSLTFQFTELLAQLSVLRTQLTRVTGQVRTLQKRADREIKAAQKANKKRKKRADGKPRAPSGFVKPTTISPELTKFLKKPAGTLMARTEVTKEINKYIVAHELQDPSNGRIIRADKKLKKLLELPAGVELTYFNLQKYMSIHFPKSKAKLAAEAKAAAATATTE